MINYLSKSVAATVLCFVCNALPAWAEEHSEQSVNHSRKEGFTLMNPTPGALMRELSPDRPDTTESPITVDAGHVQIELSFFDYSRDTEDGTRSDVRTFFDTNIKLGLLNDVDLQFVIAAHTIERSKATGESSNTTDGLADITLRLKINLWGNDAHDRRIPPGLEATAFGIMPFITLPTGSELSSGHVQGGLIIPLSIALTEQIGLGLMAEIDFVYDDIDDDYDVEFVHSAVLGFDVVGPLGAYLEYIGILSSESDAHYIAFASTGITLAITDDLMLDLGIRIGLNDAAEDFGFFTGMTVRF